MAERYQPHPRPRGPRKGYLYVKVDRKRRRRERKLEETRRGRAEREACKPRYAGGWPVEGRAAREDLVAPERVRRGLAVLGTAHVQRGAAAELDHSRSAISGRGQAVTVADEDECRVTMAMTAAARAVLMSFSTLGPGQILAPPDRRVGGRLSRARSAA